MNHRTLTTLLTPVLGEGEASAVSRMVFEDCFGLSLTDLLLGKDTLLSANEHTKLEKIAQQLVRGVPVQQVLGHADFCGHRFRVTPDVLIPRPETEELVAWATEQWRHMAAGHPSASPLGVLDLGTGSGCIAVALSLACPEARVLAVDVSEAALDVARSSAEALNAPHVAFCRQDMLDTESLATAVADHFGTTPLALVVSNPPYIHPSEAAEMTATVLDHEPHTALFAPADDPLCFYRAVADVATRQLCPDGAVMVELNSHLATQTATLFSQAGFADVQLRNDQFGRPRMLMGRCQKD